MAKMTNMTLNVNKAGEYTLQTAKKFLNEDIKVVVPEGSATLEATGEASKPTIEKGEGTVSAGGITTTKPTEGYYIAAKAKSAAIDLDIDQTAFTEGYIKADGIEASGSIDAVDGDEYYIPVTASSIGVSATKPEGYTENKDAIVPSEGYLKIEEGYMPKTIISLATLIPDDATLGKTKDASTMLTGTTAYDVDGNLVVGTMATITPDKFGATADSTVTASETATDGFYTLKNTVSVNMEMLSDGYVEATTYGDTLEGVTVGKIKEGIASGADEDGIVPAGGEYKVTAGYYPEDITVTAAAEAPKSGITGSLTADIDLATEKVEGKTYATITGNGSMATGNIYNGTATAETKYLEIYSGDYEVI